MTATHPLVFALGIGMCLAALGLATFAAMGIGTWGIALSRRRPGVEKEASLLTRATNSAVSFVERKIKRDATFGSQESLEQAGLRLRQADFILMVSCAAVTTGLMGLMLGGFGMGMLLMLLAPAGAMVVLKILTERRRSKFAAQLGDTLQLMSGGLRAGHSLLRAVDAVSSDADSPTSEEFARLVNETRLGRDLKDAMADAGRRLKSEDFNWVAQAIGIHREVGGDLAEVLDNVGETIRERMEIKGQVKALSAEGKMSAYVLIGLPIGMFLFLNVSSPAYIGTLYTSVIGWAMLAAGAAMMGFGSWWLSQVVKIKF